MNISDAYTQVFFGRSKPPEVFDMVLRNKGVEVSRASVTPKDWKVSRGSASVTVRFGPFPSGVSFDEAAIFADGAEIHSEPVGATKLPAGGEFAWTPEVVAVA